MPTPCQMSVITFHFNCRRKIYQLMFTFESWVEILHHILDPDSFPNLVPKSEPDMGKGKNLGLETYS